MYYLAAGEGPTITLLHGAALTIETNWSNQIPIFSRKYKIVAIDLRGHGRTNNPSNILNYDIMTRDVVKFLEKLKIGKTHLVGFSMGGMIAARIALDHPELVKTLVLCSSGYNVSKEGLDLFAMSVNPNLLEANQELADFYRRIHRSNGPEYWKQLLALLIKSSKGHKISLPVLSRINVPTLIVVGDSDPYGFTEQAIEMCGAIKGSELAVFPNTSHMVPNNKSKLFNETVMDFLERRGS